MPTATESRRLSLSACSRVLGISRATIRAHLGDDGAPERIGGKLDVEELRAFMAQAAPKAAELAEIRNGIELSDRCRLMGFLSFIQGEVTAALGDDLRPKVAKAFVGAWDAYKRKVKARII